MACPLNQLEIALTRGSRFRVVDGERAKYLVVFREQRLRPGCPQPIA